MYVALTRAMDKIYLLHAEQRLLYGEHKYNAASQFIADIKEDLIEFLPPRQRHHVSVRDKSSIGHKPVPLEVNVNEPTFAEGDRVYHASFGAGMIVSIQGGVATIAFDNNKFGIKKLALSIAPLKKV